jgi:prepilin-type N-terminal cleavage/methylation domain-containing protein
MSNFTSRRLRGFSLIEMVIVVVIIAILSAIAVPKLSRGSQGAAESALHGDLRVLRAAVDLYMTEHGGVVPADPGVTPKNFVDQLTKYTDDQGTVSATKTGAFVYGPYLREVPTLPLGSNKGQSGVAIILTASPSTIGWVYAADHTANTYTITANLAVTETDSSGKAYNAY